MAAAADATHSLTLNEGALQQLPEEKRPHFIFEWLRFLDKVLVAAHKSDIKSCQQKLVGQLTNLLSEPLGPPARRLLARCLATLFSVGDTFLLFGTLNKCNDIIKVKDDSPNYLPTRLAAICCLGSMYEKLGRMMGRSYEETVTTLVRSLKSSESQTRLEIMITLEKICVGLGTAAPMALRETSRAARAALLAERAPAVRAAAAHALRALLPLTGVAPADLDATPAACLRAAHQARYPLRMAVAELLGSLIAATQAGDASNNGKAKMGQHNVQQSKKDTKNATSLEEALNVLMGAFLRGGSSFLKGEIIKSGSGVNREVRLCVTHAYVIFVQEMGGSWLERNMTTFLNHVLDLVANPKAASSHVDAVYSRKCINYILRSTLGKMLGEKAQASACREIVQIVLKQMNSIDFSPENAKDCNQETLFSQHLLVCALSEAGELALQLGTSVQNLLADPSLNMIHAICTVLVHPCVAARLAAAWCLRCVCVALPSQITPSIDRCIEALDNTRTTPEAISGYAGALAGVLGAVRTSALGVPHGCGKVAFNAAEQLLRSAGQSSRLTAARTNAGWLIVGAICTLGVPVVRGLLPRMLLLWRNSFPRSAKELESEKARGDAFTWQVTLEGRAGALSALHSLLVHCPSLANNEDTSKRLAQPIDGAVAVLANIGTVVRGYGGALKAPAALLRLRLCETCAVLPAGAPPPTAPLLRSLAAELAGAADPGGATVATGILRTVLHPRDVILLGPEVWIYDTDHADIEEQLVCPLGASGSGALEHDPCCLYRALPPDRTSPGPLPLGVAVIDASVRLFGQIFCRAVNKHRLQMLEHFTECIKMSKGARLEALQINMYTALLLALKGLAEAKASLGQDDVKSVATNVVLSGLSAQSTVVRAAAASCAGRLCACVSEQEALAFSEKVLALARTSPQRTARAAAAAAVGAVQRTRGAAASAAALPVLRSLALDASSPELQVWSLHALSVIADACGPMFRAHVEPALALALRLLFATPPGQEDVHRALGRLLSALITVVGPELQGGAVGRFVCGCAALAESGGWAEAIGCLQQLQLFCPKHISLHTLVPMLCRNLSSPELAVRRAALCCLRQLSQREAAEVCRYALLARDHVPARPYCGVTISEAGLCGALLAYLDTEREPAALSYARDTLACCLLAPTASGAPQRDGAPTIRDWLALCKKVLTVRQEDTNTAEQDPDGEGDDDQAEFHADTEQTTHPPVQPRWPTRVFAMECVQKIMAACEANGDAAHFDLVKAKEKLKANSSAEYLVLHLPELVRMAFVGATSESDALRLCSLRALQLLIQKYARAPEPDFPGHLLLEQYMAQVGAALRPAFAGDTASHVTAAACDVCSTWIGCGVARDINDLRRVHQLLVSSLDKLSKRGNTTLVYNESMSTLEKLSILKAWAEVYIVAMVSNGSAPGSYARQLDTKPASSEAELARWRRRLDCDLGDLTGAECAAGVDGAPDASADASDDEFGEFESKGESLLRLVEPELASLGENWLAALRDHALLSLPPEFASQLPHGGGAFYSAETAEASRPHYARAWPSLLYAAALRFNAHIREGRATDNRTADNRSPAADNRSPTDNGNSEFFEPVDEKFHLLFGVCMEALCAQRDTTVENTVSVLLSLATLLDAPENRARLIKDRALAIELCNLLHRIGLTQESVAPLLLAADVLRLVVAAAREDLRARMQHKVAELAPEESSEGRGGGEGAGDGGGGVPRSVLEAVQTLGEGGPTGDLPPGRSLVFACLEVSLCLLVRRLPALSPLEPTGKVGVIGVPRGLGAHGDTLLVKSLACAAELPTLTSPQGALSILPSILYLATGVLRESGGAGGGAATAAAAAALLLRQAAASRAPALCAQTRDTWAALLQSTLAKVTDLVKSDVPEQRVEPLAGARAMAALLPHAAPAPALHCVCINHFRQCLESPDHETFAACCEVVRGVWAHGGAESAWPRWWARALAPRVVARAAAARRPASAAHAHAAVAALGALDDLVAAAPLNARLQLLWLLVPLVTSYLRDAAELPRAPAHARALHDFALQWLGRVGPKYPQEFKAMMQQSAELRGKLESAVKASQQGAGAREARGAAPAPRRAPRPTIQLKTDFSDFR